MRPSGRTNVAALAPTTKESLSIKNTILSIKKI
jgi:hypothetical protein